MSAAPFPADERRPLAQIFLVFLRLGLTSFGGPVAHLAYFREELVARRRWVEERAYADLVALCQFLPGPASSQVGIGIGLAKGGLAGAFAAWLGFTAPSAIALTLFGLGVAGHGTLVDPGVLHGLKVVAVAVVAQAVWAMARSLCPDGPRATLAVVAAIVALTWPGAPGQLAVIALGALAGIFLPPAAPELAAAPLGIRVGRRLAVGALALFFALLVGLPLAEAALGSRVIALLDAFYRSGALVFGGGHVILPLLQAEVVPPGWVSNDLFLAGYGAAQAVPGPLSTFAAYLGAVMSPEPNGWRGALLCLAAIFAPSFLLVLGALPFWDGLRRHARARAALGGVNAAVVGLLAAALYDPLWTSAIASRADFGLAAAAFAALAFWKVPPWLVVAATAAGGWALGGGS